MGIQQGSTPPQSYPYATHLDVRYPALEVVDVQELIDAVTDGWYNQTLCKVNDSVVRRRRRHRSNR